uniref:Uncharacterized protein n=1 Tax=Arundo donax TaxID=35708 RepID=A0A0A9HGS4_ARUDO
MPACKCTIKILGCKL